MLKCPNIEDIGEMRRREGIDDVELRAQIRALRIGDLVKITLLNAAAASAGETMVVRITSIKLPIYRGRLMGKPAAHGSFQGGGLVRFTASHIHSLAKGS